MTMLGGGDFDPEVIQGTNFTGIKLVCADWNEALRGEGK